MTIEIREKDKPDGKPACIGSQEISLFLENGDATVNVPLTRDDVVVGMVKFETYHEKQVIATTPVDSKYPHVKQGCIVCKDTHKGASGANYSCIYCVCLRCKGTGTNIEKKTPCTNMKVQS